MSKTKRVAFLSVVTALSVALLYLAAYLPVARIGVAAAAGVMVAFAVMPFGVAGGALTFAATAILSFVIVPDRGPVFLYAIFFGIYPILKSFFERLTPVFEWIFKLLFMNALLLVFYFLIRELVFPALEYDAVPVLAVFAVSNAAFFVYDYGFSKLLTYYYRRFSGLFR